MMKYECCCEEDQVDRELPRFNLPDKCPVCGKEYKDVRLPILVRR